MRYAEFKDHVMQLIDRYSSNAKILDNLYNDQSDYAMRIPSLLNSALTDVSINGRAFSGELYADDFENSQVPGWLRTEVPPDFIRMKPVLMLGDRPYYDQGYYRTGPYINVRTDLVRSGSVLEYERYPRPVPNDPGADIDLMVIDGDNDQIYAAALYVAGRLVVDEDAFVYSSLMNEYDDRLTNMKSTRWAEITYTPDVYGLDYGGMYGCE